MPNHLIPERLVALHIAEIVFLSLVESGITLPDMTDNILSQPWKYSPSRYCTGTHSFMMSRNLFCQIIAAVSGSSSGSTLLQLIASIMPIAFGKSASLYLQTLLGHTEACLWDTFQLKLRVSPQ